MKKVITLLLIAIIAISCFAMFAGCDSGDDNVDKDTNSETYKGTLSQLTYQSVEEAVKGFLSEEISGAAFTAEYVKYIKTLDLSKQEINELIIDENLKNDIDNVEIGKVEYKEITAQNDKQTKMSNNNVKRDVYVLKSKDNYRFFSPSVKLGESLTKSYFNHIMNFSLEKYKNFSMIFDIETILYNEGYTHTYKRLYKFTEDVEYSEMFDYKEYEDFYSGNQYINDEYFHVQYLLHNIYEITHSSDSEWSVVNILDYDDIIKENRNVFFIYFAIGGNFTLALDYASLFYKTVEGFELRYNIEEYMDVEYYSANLVDDKIINVSYKNVGNNGYSIYNASFFNFGTTVVDVPNVVYEAIKEYEANKQI